MTASQSVTIALGVIFPHFLAAVLFTPPLVFWHFAHGCTPLCTRKVIEEGTESSPGTELSSALSLTGQFVQKTYLYHRMSVPNHRAVLILQRNLLCSQYCQNNRGWRSYDACKAAFRQQMSESDALEVTRLYPASPSGICCVSSILLHTLHRSRPTLKSSGVSPHVGTHLIDNFLLCAAGVKAQLPTVTGAWFLRHLSKNNIS